MRVGPCESRLLFRMFAPIGSSRPVPLVHLYHELRTRYLPRRGARAGGHVLRTVVGGVTYSQSDPWKAVLVDRGSQPTTIIHACSFSTRVARSAPFPANRAMVPKSRKSRLKRHHEQDVNYCSIIVKLLCSLNYCVSYYKNRE